MKAASLFAGIGGFDLAAGRVGAEVVLQAEIDPSARAVLRARHTIPTIRQGPSRVDVKMEQ